MIKNLRQAFMTFLVLAGIVHLLGYTRFDPFQPDHEISTPHFMYDLTTSKNPHSMASNPVVYFEIPVSDLDRAITFYQNVFGYDFEREVIDGNEMALFPMTDHATGITGALAKGEVYIPSKTGSIVYFHTNDIDGTLAKAHANGGKTLYPKTPVGSSGFVAEFEDSEGNRIALHSLQP